MKKLICILFLTIMSCELCSQVGINTTSPKGTLDVRAKNTDGQSAEGVMIPRLSGDALHIADQNGMYGQNQDGMLVYVYEPPGVDNRVGQTKNIIKKGYFYFDSEENVWINMAIEKLKLDCFSGIFSGTLIKGLPASGVTTKLSYTGGNGISFSSQNISSTGVTGLTAKISAGNFTSGNGSLNFTIEGIPNNYGTAVFPITINGQTCNINIPVHAALPIGKGSIKGKTCFDVVMVNDDADCGSKITRTPLKADFTQSSTYSQTYTFTALSVVSNVRFIYVNTNGQVINSITGGNPGNNITTAVNATVLYNQGLNALASGKTRANALTAKIVVIYNDSADNSGTDVQLELPISIQDCACCGAYVSPGVWKNFMCHNLGADTSVSPFVPSASIHGARYQWGVPTPILSQSQDQSNNGSVTGWNTSYAVNGSWLDTAKTVFDPCPVGYRVPTADEWQKIINANTSQTLGTTFPSNDNYGSGEKIGDFLFLPYTGYRNATDGSLVGRGYYGYYRSSTIGVYPNSRSFTVQNGSNTVSDYGMTYGFNIRCISE